MTKSARTGKSKPSRTTTRLHTLNDAGKNPPWKGPELTKSPEYILDALRDTKHMIKSLQERESKLRAEVGELYEQGLLSHLVDEENSQKYNYEGVSVTLVPGKKTRVWFPEFQQQIDVLQEQIKAIELKAESMRAYNEKQGNSYWRVTTQSEL